MDFIAFIYAFDHNIYIYTFQTYFQGKGDN